MLPPLHQRLLIFAAAFLSALPLLASLVCLRAADGSSGVSLFDAQCGLLLAAGLVLLAFAIALPLCLIVSCTGHPLSGAFSLCAALGALAWAGGPIDGWLYRNELPGQYGLLLIELLLWFVPLVILLLAVQRWRPALRQRLPQWLMRDDDTHDVVLAMPGKQSLLAGLLTAAIGGALALLAILTTGTGQVVWSLFFSFLIAALIAQVVLAQPNPLLMLATPALLGIAAYAYVLLRYPDAEAVFYAWYNLTLPTFSRMPGPALALPLHYVSAGSAGVIAGIGWGQALAHNASSQNSEEAARAKPQP